MTAQTSYSINQRVSLAGVVYAQAPHDIISRAAEGTIPFGVVVSRGTDKNAQAVVGGTEPLGVSVRFLDTEGAINTGAIDIKDTVTAAIIRDGYIWVAVPSGCTAGDVVSYNTTTGVIDAGAPGAGEAALDGAFFDSSAAAGELAVLRLTA